MTSTEDSFSNLFIFILIPIYSFFLFAPWLFLSAGTILWIEAWIYILIFMIPTTFYYNRINKKDARVIRNRIKIRKTGVTDEIRNDVDSDKTVYPILILSYFCSLIIAGLDFKFTWTSVSFIVQIIGFTCELFGIILINMAQMENAFASKLLDINEGQTLIDTGLYAHVRHPLYAGVLLMLIGTPLGLSSWYAVIPVLVTFTTLLIRIKFEEEMLSKAMDGYVEYKNRVRYRLIPKIL